MEWLALFLAIGLLIFLIALYNGLISIRNLKNNAWSDVDVFLKRRYELIPNLVTVVKQAASHEQQTFERVVRARSLVQPHERGAERAQHESELSGALRGTMLLAESYPELKANDSFLELQRELAETENKIAKARQYYNACVRDFNIKVESFPSSLVAGMIGLKTESFFELEFAAEAAVPEIGEQGNKFS